MSMFMTWCLRGKPLSPEALTLTLDLARALLARGITGKVILGNRTIIDIEAAAKLRTASLLTGAPVSSLIRRVTMNNSPFDVLGALYEAPQQPQSFEDWLKTAKPGSKYIYATRHALDIHTPPERF